MDKNTFFTQNRKKTGQILLFCAAGFLCNCSDYSTNPFEKNSTASTSNKAEIAVTPRSQISINIETTKVTLDNGVEIIFVKIPAGEFVMGSPGSEAGRTADESSLHKVIITQPFWMGQYEVTQSQWTAVMGANPSKQIGDNLPVQLVSWDETQVFLEKLNASGKGTFRLPTEAEWEYACRAGSTTRFFWGDDEAPLKEYAVDSVPIAPGGSKKANAWGLYDTIGNVWEWCGDVYSFYPQDPQTDPTGPATGNMHVFRGGCVGKKPEQLRSAVRIGQPPSVKDPTVGFRLVMAASDVEAH